MTETMRDVLARAAETVERPMFDVGDLVAQAERRLVRRRLGVVAASAAAVVVIVTGGIALRPDDQRLPPAPPAPRPTQTLDPKPALSPAIYFDALHVDGDDLTDPVPSIGGQADIYLAREDGTARQIIATEANEHCPQVSPEGDLLAYLAGRTVVVRRLDPTGDPGTTTARVKLDARELPCPQWSPDGRRLAIATTGYDAPDQLIEVHVIDLAGTDRVLATQRDQWMPPSEIAWSPDGAAIAFTTGDSVWVAPLDGGKPTTVWQGRARQAPTSFPPWPGKPEMLAWLATGELAVSAMTAVDEDRAVHIVDPDTGRDKVVGTFHVGDQRTWAWSPDGSRLVFADTDGTARMFDRASGKAVPLRPQLDGGVLPIWKLVWSPDGQRLVGTAADTDPSTTVFALVSMNPDGTAVDVLTPWTMALYREADPSWSPR